MRGISRLAEDLLVSKVQHLTEGIIYTVTAVITSDIASYHLLHSIACTVKLPYFPLQYTAAAQTLPELYPVIGDGMGKWKWLFDQFIL